MRKCFLVIVPFSSKWEAERPEFKKYARNLLEVNDEYYEKILDDYKKWKLIQKTRKENR